MLQELISPSSVLANNNLIEDRGFEGNTGTKCKRSSAREDCNPHCQLRLKISEKAIIVIM
jgi:hypothetical protein